MKLRRRLDGSLLLMFQRSSTEQLLSVEEVVELAEFLNRTEKKLDESRLAWIPISVIPAYLYGYHGCWAVRNSEGKINRICTLTIDGIPMINESDDPTIEANTNLSAYAFQAIAPLDEISATEISIEDAYELDGHIDIHVSLDGNIWCALVGEDIQVGEIEFFARTGDDDQDMTTVVDNLRNRFPGLIQSKVIREYERDLLVHEEERDTLSDAECERIPSSLYDANADGFDTDFGDS